MRRFLLSLCATLALTLGVAAEDAKVASGITASNFLTDSTGQGLNNVEHTFALTNAFSTNGTTTVTVHWTSHGRSTSAPTNKISIEDGPTIDGLDMNGAWTVASVPNANTLTFTHTGTASGTTATTGSANATKTHWGDDGKMRFLCRASHINYDDPIKFPGIRGAAHLHQFFGNTLTDYSSTYASLRSTGQGTCDGEDINRTAYWMPALITNSGTTTKSFLAFQWYYVNHRYWLVEKTSPLCPGGTDAAGRVVACPINPIKKLQRGQKAIFGFDPSQDGLPASYGGGDLGNIYMCVNTNDTEVVGAGNYRYLHHRTSPELGLSSDAACPSSGRVKLRMTSPQCWNGDLDHSGTHYDHFTYPAQDFSGNLVCPATHPNRHLEFEIIVDWSYSGGISSLSGWWLSSDRAGGADYEAGETWHWDMFFAWEDGAGQDVLAFWSKNTMGKRPDPEAGFPYTFGTIGGGDDAARDWVGGKGMRNFNNGGLGVGPFSDCTELGAAWASCRLKATSVGTTDQEVTVPVNPGVRLGRSRMR